MSVNDKSAEEKSGAGRVSKTSPRRTADKDHISKQADRLALVPGTSGERSDADPLVFWTIHSTKPTLVDLTVLASGTEANEEKVDQRFSGRRQLIEQLAPAFQVRHAFAAPRTIDTIIAGLRMWWRLFDAIEVEEQAGRAPSAFAKRVNSVLDLGPLHGSMAVQSAMNRNNFHSFVVLADITRLALGEKRPLHWTSPSKRPRKLAVLLPADEVKALYHGIRDDWQKALDRWALGDGLVAGPGRGGFRPGQSPASAFFLRNYEQLLAQGNEPEGLRANERFIDQAKWEKSLHQGLTLWHATAERVGHSDLDRQDLIDSTGSANPPENFLAVSRISESIHPNGQDIRSAFHLCLAVGGVNIAVLTQMQLQLSEITKPPGHLLGPGADEAERRSWILKQCPFLVESPIEGEYYIEAWKDRSKSWISRSYKWKQHLTPGPILVELILRTWPLRMALVRRFEVAVEDLRKGREKGDRYETLDALQQRVNELSSGMRSPWVYRGYRGITWLDDTDYAVLQPSLSYLETVTIRLNEGRLSRGLTGIGRMEPRRFRDAYAAWALQYSGGEVLAVMVALDHKRLSTTWTYLENTAVRSTIAKKYRAFSEALFSSLGSGVVDPTLIAMGARYAGKAEVERIRMTKRLAEYRAAVKSRYGVGCRDPHNPSVLADPAFRADGEKWCTTHRCTLCHENAIITPAAYPGLMLRQAELEIMEERMPVGVFKLSSFDAELQNTRTALMPLHELEAARLASTVERLKDEIRRGYRRLPGFSAMSPQTMPDESY